MSQHNGHTMLVTQVVAPPPAPRMQEQIWFIGLLGVYSMVELGFNHRMLDLSGGFLSSSELDGLQLWGRVIAGLGLSMLLLRWLDARLQQRWKAVLISFTLGMSVMWHFQKMVIDHLVERASLEDKQFNIYLLNKAALAANGQLFVRGERLGSQGMDLSVRSVVQALFPASALGMSIPDFEGPDAGRWQAQAAALALPGAKTLLDDAYRNTITPPVALGLSSFFGLLNLAQCLGLALLLCLRRAGHPKWSAWLRKNLLILSALLILGLTSLHRDAFIDSPAYQQHLRPSAWDRQPLLAVLLAWGLRAEPAWHGVSRWAHQDLMQGFSFTWH